MGISFWSPQYLRSWTNFKIWHGDSIGSKVFRKLLNPRERAPWWLYRAKTKWPPSKRLKFLECHKNGCTCMCDTSNERFWRENYTYEGIIWVYLISTSVLGKKHSRKHPKFSKLGVGQIKSFLSEKLFTPYTCVIYQMMRWDVYFVVDFKFWKLMHPRLSYERLCAAKHDLAKVHESRKIKY